MHVLTPDPVDQLVALLAAEGVQASMDPADLNLPAVWVAVDEVARPTLGPQLRLVAALYLISPDTDPRRALGHLGELHAKVLAVLTPDGPVTSQAVVMPADPTPPPGPAGAGPPAHRGRNNRMTINAVKLGPGTLTLGTGTPLECSSQLTACKVVPSESVTTTEARKVLSGETLGGSSSASFTFALTGMFLQDLGAAGVVAYSWANAGELTAFTFTPNTAAGATVTGSLYPVPLEVGGDDPEGAEMDSDFTWRIDGTPTYTD